ncbi:hypothetical protein EYF80_015949 [Liparis tanakae]|uniref:Uncharacterized protein n=1 Tax=Liparis tanakae TaxID=230148 RepID=A0A4Z2I964_9TELE|nr:hypothetical protein EYF80_015949 [Liparis tanakae]
MYRTSSCKSIPGSDGCLEARIALGCRAQEVLGGIARLAAARPLLPGAPQDPPSPVPTAC